MHIPNTLVTILMHIAQQMNWLKLRVHDICEIVAKAYVKSIVVNYAFYG